MDSNLQGLVWLVVLLASNAFFVGAEFAVISARRAQIEPRADRGNIAAKLTLKAMEQVSLMLATAQLGITVSSLLILVIAEPAIQKLLEVPLAMIGISGATGYVTAFVIALLIVTYLHVVLGEMLPKNISISIPDRAALVLAPMLYFVAQAVKPVVWAMNQVSNVILRTFGFTPRDEAHTAYTLEQVEGIVEVSREEGLLTDSSGTVRNTFEFTEKQVRDVLVPMNQVMFLNEDATVRDLQDAVAEFGFSRYPVKSDSNELLGYWHIKDGLDSDEVSLNASLPRKRLRRLVSVAEAMELEDALDSLRRSGAHIARCHDAAGEVVGLLFLEDIIEELVGKIQDATRRD